MRHPAVKATAARASLAPLLLLLAGGCVTTYTPVDELNAAAQLPLSLPVSIPIPSDAGGGNRLLLEFYSGILRRLQEAADDGNVQLLDALVESYDKPGIPESIAQHLSGYRAMARGIRFSQHVLQSAALELRSDQPAVAIADGEAAVPLEVPPLGSALQLQLRVSPMAEKVVLGGSGDSYPIGFSVSVTVEDEDVDGSTHSLHTDDMVWLPESFELASGNDLLLPIEIAAAPAETVRRNVIVRVDMRGHVLIDGMRAPIKCMSIGAGSFTQWPSGYEILAKQPLAALKLALVTFQKKDFASVYLASLTIPAEQRLEAAALLIDQVRFGRADQAHIAMAALRNVTGLSIAIGDRDAWLTWWQSPAMRERLSPSAAGR